MKHLWLVAGTLALIAAPLAAQAEEPADAAPTATTPKIEQAANCAAVLTILSALIGGSSKPNPVMEDKLKRSAVRWLKHAATLPPQDDRLVRDRYLAMSDGLENSVFKGNPDPAEVRAKLQAELANCVAAELETFGTTHKDL